jgi:hypothetical protein
MDEGAELLPHALDHRLPSAGMPAIPGGVGQDGVLDGGLNEPLVQFGALARIVPGDGVAVRPILVLIRPALFRGMIGAGVVDQIRRIRGKQYRPLVVHDSDNVIRLGAVAAQKPMIAE